MADIQQLSGYEYEPATSGGKFIRLTKKGDSVRLRIASTPVKYKDFSKFKNAEMEKFAWLAIERLSMEPPKNEVKIFNAGIQIYREIKKLALDPEWGNPMEYDITINRTEEQGSYYSVIPNRSNAGPITEEEQELIATAKINPLEVIHKIKGKKGEGTKTFGQPGEMPKINDLPEPDTDPEPIPF